MEFLAVFGWLVLVVMALGGAYFSSQMTILTLLFKSVGADGDAKVGSVISLCMIALTICIASAAMIWHPF